MMLDPGSFSGMRSSPNPQRGPEASQRISFEISSTSTPAYDRAVCVNQFVVRGKRRKFIRMRAERQARQFPQFFSPHVPQLRMRVQSRATADPPIAKS